MFTCSSDLDLLEAVVVEPRLEPVDVELRSGLTARRLLGDVLVDPIGGLARLVDSNGADRDEESHGDGEEDRVDENDGRPPGHFQPGEVADERIEREGDHAGREEQEQDVTERLRQQECDDERDGEDDQLDPSRDLDRRAGAGHARIVPSRLESARRRPC